MRVLDRLEDPRRDAVAGLVLAVVQARHDPVGSREHLVGEIEAPLLEHVDLDSLEHDELRVLAAVGTGGRLQRLVEPVDLIPLGEQPRAVEPSGHRHSLAVIGYRDV